MIIVEGSDKVGKTTLCETLAERLGGPVVHWGLLPDDFDFFWGYAEQAHVDAIWDRGWMSEMAYAWACNRKKRLTDQHRMLVRDMLRLYGAVNVTIVCEPAVLAKRLDDAADDKFDRTTVLGANRWFSSSYLYHGTDVLIKCDARNPHPAERDVQRIIEFHEKRVSAIKSVIGDHLCLQKLIPFARSAAVGPQLAG